MDGIDSRKLSASDEALIEQTRAGDQRAFAELWRRHFRSGARVARQFTSSIDADDLVSEAYTRIYQRVLAGGGPTGAFRPYLYTTIRNLASTWGAASKDVQVADIADFEDPASIDDPAASALDKTLTARAFRSLPDRWQSVLWYTEVEGLDPHEVAPLLGMSANGVAALSYRAREGLRKAWLQAHINDASASGDCQWTISRIGDNTRHGLSPRDAERLAFHLTTCARCSIISEEVDEVGSRLAMVLIPLILGGVVGGAFLGSFGAAGSSVAATAIPAIPAAIGGSTVLAGASLFGAALAPMVLVGTLALAVALGGGALVMAQQADEPAEQGTTQSQGSADELLPAPTALTDGALAADDPANIAAGAVDGVVDGIVSPLTEAITAPPPGRSAPGGGVVTTSIALSGRGAPGATVSARAGALVYATTVVRPDGTFSLLVSGLPWGTGSVQLSQALGGVLGLLRLNIPLSLDTGPVGIVVQLLN